MKSFLGAKKRSRKLNSINILVLTITIVVSFLIFGYTHYKTSYDTFHKDHESLYRVIFDEYSHGSLTYTKSTIHTPVGPALRDNFPEVQDYSRLYQFQYLLLKYNDTKSFRETNFAMVDSNFVNMLVPELISGSADVVNDQRYILMSESTAKKYFGNENPVGKTLKTSSMYPILPENVTVKGVYRDFPEDSYFSYDLLVSEEFWATDDNSDWTEDALAETFVKVNKNTSIPDLEAKINAFIEDRTRDVLQKSGRKHVFHLQPITDVYVVNNLEDGITMKHGLGKFSYFLLNIIAFFILIGGLVNCINVNLAISIENSNEYKVRKLFGAGIGEFIALSTYRTFMIVLSSTVLASLILLLVTGSYEERFEVNINLASFLTSGVGISFLALLIGGALLPGVVIGLYNFVFNNSKDITSVRVSLSRSAKIISKFSLFFQFALSFFCLAFAFNFYIQSRLLTDKDLGFNYDDRFVFFAPYEIGDLLQFQSNEKYKTFQNELISDPAISEVRSSIDVPGFTIGAGSYLLMRLDGDKTIAKSVYNWVEPGFVDMFDLNILAGSTFKKEDAYNLNKIVINKKCARDLGFTDYNEAIGKPIMIAKSETVGVARVTIAGVIDNFVNRNINMEMASYHLIPVAYSGGFFTAKINPNSDRNATVRMIEAKFTEFFKNTPFHGTWHSDLIKRQTQPMDNISGLIFIALFAAIFTMGVGLWSISIVMIRQKLKEVGVRRVLGGSVSHILRLFMARFILTLAACLVIVFPLTYLMNSRFLQDLPDRINFTFFHYLTPMLIMIVIVQLTVVFSVLKYAMRSPVNALRTE